jgi:hypothetical protein
MDSTIDPSASGSSSDAGKIYPKLDTLNIDGTSPKQGDRVSGDWEGVVDSIENDSACVRLEKINGEPPQAPPSNSDDNEPDEASLLQASQGVPVGGLG